jgi:hypothetical protein
MKKLFFILIPFSISLHLEAQTTWNTAGNSANSTAVLGTNNAQPLTFRTNGVNRASFATNGAFIVNNLSGSGTRIVTTNASGQLGFLPAGTASQVLLGNGTWGTLAASSWLATGNDIYFNSGRLGIGLINPQSLLDVNGNARIRSNLTVDGDIIITGKIFTPDEFQTRALVSDSIKMDSLTGIYGQTNIHGDLTAFNEFKVAGNTQLQGDASVSGILRIDQYQISNYRLANQFNTNLTVFGPVGGPYSGPTNPLPLDPCITGNIMVNNLNAFDGLIQSYTFDLNAGYASMIMGSDGANGIIDSRADMNTPGNGRLLLNFYCGNDVLACTGAQGGSVFLCNNSVNSRVVIGDGVLGNSNHANAKLQVGGKIVAKELYILNSGNWPDYVFDSSYTVMPLTQTEAFYRQHHHLPGVPSAAQVDSTGIDVAQMSAILLQKVEELTLIIVEQQKQIDALKNQQVQPAKQ